MSRKIIFAAALCLSLGLSARAQTGDRRFEVGGQFSVIDATNGRATLVSAITTNVDQRHMEPGFGARVGYSVNRYFTVEAETNFFPRERALTDNNFDGGRKWQGLFGVKVGRRGDKVGIFAKARPGFVNFKDGDLRRGGVCIAIFPQPLGCFQPAARTDFAFDLGGVVELYPSPHTILRFDAGDTILRTGTHNVPALGQSSPTGPTFFSVATSPAATTHNFQGSVGFGYRF